MDRTLLSLAAHLDALAAFVYLAYLVRAYRPLVFLGRGLIGIGLVFHAVSLFRTLGPQGGLPSTLGQGLSLVSFLLLALFFALDLGYRKPVLGAVLAPLAAAAALPGLYIGGATTFVGAGAVRPFLPLHVVVALVGFAACAAAAGVGGMYLLMEREVKAKRFGILFARLPSLQFLDELNRRLTVGGFLALTVTVITGAFFVSGRPLSWGPKEVTTAVAWVMFAALLQARFFAGWQGRRVALLTMAGFPLLIVSFFSAYPFSGVSP